MLRNLVDNAIKHHDRGDGLVVIEGKPLRAGVEIAIVDDGPGIAKRYHTAIFQPFLKLDQELTGTRAPIAATSGSGIGLSLVRKTADIAGATLTLDSDPEQCRGTTFRLRWPGRIVV